MNKLAIPVILSATVLVAGMFAFMPVEQASTVHTIISPAAGTTTGAVAATPSFTTVLTAPRDGVAAISCTAVDQGSDGTIDIFVSGVDSLNTPVVGQALIYVLSSGDLIQLQDSNAATADATATCTAAMT